MSARKSSAAERCILMKPAKAALTRTCNWTSIILCIRMQQYDAFFLFFSQVINSGKLPCSRTARHYFNLLYEHRVAFMLVSFISIWGTGHLELEVCCEGNMVLEPS